MKEQIQKSGLPCVTSSRFGGCTIQFFGGRGKSINFAPLIKLLIVSDQRMLTIRQVIFSELTRIVSDKVFKSAHHA